jgi:hypothetical protein
VDGAIGGSISGSVAGSFDAGCSVTGGWSEDGVTESGSGLASGKLTSVVSIVSIAADGSGVETSATGAISSAASGVTASGDGMESEAKSEVASRVISDVVSDVVSDGSICGELSTGELSTGELSTGELAAIGSDAVISGMRSALGKLSSEIASTIGCGEVSADSTYTRGGGSGGCTG